MFNVRRNLRRHPRLILLLLDFPLLVSGFAEKESIRGPGPGAGAQDDGCAPSGHGCHGRCEDQRPAEEAKVNPIEHRLQIHRQANFSNDTIPMMLLQRFERTKAEGFQRVSGRTEIL